MIQDDPELKGLKKLKWLQTQLKEASRYYEFTVISSFIVVVLKVCFGALTLTTSIYFKLKVIFQRG
jgi:hypothetical protein